MERAGCFIDQVDSDLDVDARESVALAFRELLMNVVEWVTPDPANRALEVIAESSDCFAAAGSS